MSRPASAPARRLRLAVFGVVADGAGSSAAAYPLVLSELLARGHAVEFFGNPNYVRPRSLEAFSEYQFRPLHLPAMERLWYRAERYEMPRALVSQLGILAYQREAVRQIERAHAAAPYDVVLCADIQPLWPSVLPVVAWPQGPPHTEATALWTPDLARALLRTRGAGHYAAVQAFYAYRVVTGRLAARVPDLLLCGSRWAAGQWERFGVPAARIEPLPYPVNVGAFSGVRELTPGSTTTFLWLGRAVPRKRLDLFVEGFALLRARFPHVRARVIGNVATDAWSRALLDRAAAVPGLSIEPPVPRASVPALFAEVSVLVQPSQHENFGFSVAEALAAGRPVVGGPTNGTLEYGGDAAFRFETYTPRSVAQALERALEAVETRGPEVSRRAREAARVFEIGAVSERLVAACEKLRSRPSRQGAGT